MFLSSFPIRHKVTIVIASKVRFMYFLGNINLILRALLNQIEVLAVPKSTHSNDWCSDMTSRVSDY